MANDVKRRKRYGMVLADDEHTESNLLCSSHPVHGMLYASRTKVGCTGPRNRVATGQLDDQTRTQSERNDGRSMKETM